MLRVLRRQEGLSIQSILLKGAKVLRALSILSTLSTPRVCRYIGALMEQPRGLSMVNSKISTQ
jgi:hypothetical protein